MPELPEVETLRSDVASTFAGRRIVSLTVEGARTVRRQDPERVRSELLGRRLTELRRRGKFLIFDFESGLTLVVHLRMSGRLRATSVDAAKAPHTHGRFGFEDGTALDFVDPRTFGELWITSPDVPELGHLGPDALTDRGKWNLVQRLSIRRGNLKGLLMNQTFLAGIGNIYADEALWQAGLRGDRVPSSLLPGEIVDLERAIIEVIDAGIAARGSTLRDRQYVDLWGRPGQAQDGHRAYGREGRPCPRCSAPICRIAFGNRSSHLCLRCQH